MFEQGFIDIWTRWYQPDARQCFNRYTGPARPKTLIDKKSRLTLANLSGAFTVLYVGCPVSFVVFVGEIIIKCVSKRLERK